MDCNVNMSTRESAKEVSLIEKKPRRPEPKGIS